MCACTHYLRGKKKKIAQIQQFNSKVLVDLLTTRFWHSTPTWWSHSCSRLSCCGFSQPFCPSWAWHVDHDMMGGGGVRATLPWPHWGTAGPGESGHAGFCSSSNGAVISGKEQGHRWGGSFIHEHPELGHRQDSLLRGVQILASENKLFPRECLKCTENLLELTFLLSQQCFAMTSREWGK